MRQVASELQDSLQAHFERVARTYPLRRALGSGTWQPTYEELNNRANALAHALLRRGGSLGDRVAILMEHDTPQIAAMLSILKAGRIVVVLSPGDAEAYLAHLLDNAGAQLIVTDETHRKLAETIAGKDRDIIRFDEEANGLTHDPGIRNSPDDVARLAYTSGSTGVPKAVMQTHRLMLSTAFAHGRVMELEPDDHIALLASISRSQGLGTTWCALAHGCSLWPFPVVEKGVTRLAAWINDCGITVYLSSPSLFRHFMKTLDDGVTFPRIRVVRLGAEQATSEDFALFQRRFPEQCIFVHTLGCSEVGNVAALRLSRNDSVAKGPLPAGFAQDGSEILLLDDDRKEVSPGGTGEIAVRARSLAAGYWRNEALTAERFYDDPQGNGIRIFRTGDLGRFDANGRLEVRGRKDARIKLRGYQVEPREVEDTLAGLPGVEKAVVYGIDDGPTHGTRLAASITLRPGKTCTAADLRNALRAQLPNYMVPSSFVFLDAFPLTPNGKIDRQKLKQSHPRVREGALSNPAKTATEVLLAGIWADAFELPGVGRQDDFFDLGGDSLIAAVIAAKVFDALKVEMHLGMFTDHPLLADLAVAIDKLSSAGPAQRTPPLTRVRRDGPLPLSFSQERIWRYSWEPQSSAAYTMLNAYRILGPLDVGLLSESLSAMVRRHEILRTSFPVMNGWPVAVIHAPEPVRLSILDLSGEAGAEEQARRAFRREGARRFDLGNGPLLSFSLIKKSSKEHWLVRVSHHIISDAESWTIFFQELALIYEAKRMSRQSSLPDHEPLQYADHAVWQRQAMRPGMPAYMESLAWWKERLARLPPRLDLPFKRTTPILSLDPAEGVIKWGLDPEIARGLDELRRQLGATYYMSRLAVLAALIAAETGQPDMVLGTYASNRNRVAVQNMFGFFSNPLSLRLHCNPEGTFRDWLIKVRDVVAASAPHCEIPFEELRRQFESQTLEVPDLTVFFTVSLQPISERFADLELKWLELPGKAMPWGFTFDCAEHNEEDACRVKFDAGLYDPEGVREFIARFRRLAAAVSRQPDLPLRELMDLSAILWRNPAGYSADSRVESVHE